MNSKKNFISLSSDKIVNKINDLTIGEDSNDYLTVNSETRFHSDVNIGGSSIKLRSTDDTNDNNFIEIMGERLHSTHVKTIRSINNNKIDGDLTIGEDDSDMLTIASKLHIPGGESGQVLTKGTDGIIEYGPTSFPSVALPNSRQFQYTHSTEIGNSGNINSGADWAHPYLIVKITPSFTHSKIAINVHCMGEFQSEPYNAGLIIKRTIGGTTTTLEPPATGNRGRVLGNFSVNYGQSNNADSTLEEANVVYVDEPNTTNEITYQVYIRNTDNSSGASQTFFYNQTVNGINVINHEVGFSSITAEEKISSNTFTTANPLLANPSTADKGKIVTVNSAGDDLEYGATYTENTTRIHKICNMLSSDVTSTTAWPSIVPTDGDLTIKKNETAIFFVNMSAYRASIALVIWTFKYSTNNGSTYTAFTDPPNGEFKHYFNATSDHQHRTGTLKFTTSSDITINSFQVDCNGYTNGEDYVGMYALITSGNAITSFTQEQALAGADGTAAFTAYGLYGNNATDVITTSGSSAGQFYNSGTMADEISNNDITADVAIRLASITTSVGISYEFTTPQIITKYRIWMHGTDSGSLQKTPKNWEFRASLIDKSTYDSTDSSTYVVLDSQTNVTSYPAITGNNGTSGSNNLNLANEYNLSTIGAYKYYVLHITSLNGSTTFSISEFALYGGGFTIPSQIGHSGKTLKTNGTALEWSAPLTGLIATPTVENKGKIVTVNAAGDDLEYGANIQEKNYKYKMLTGRNPLTISGRPNDNSTNYTIGAGAVLFNDGTDNLEVTITPVSNSSQILISANIMGEFGNDTGDSGWGFFTLQKTQNGVSSLIYPSTYNSYLSSANINYHSGDANSTIESSSFKYVDILTSNSPVTYCVAVVTETTDGQHRFYTNGCEGSSPNAAYERGLSIITAEELGGNAITSFTQEQALAGAGGTAAFTAYGIHNTTYISLTDTANYGDPQPQNSVGKYEVNHTIVQLYDNYIERRGCRIIHKNDYPVSFTIDFNTPQIVTKYRMWARSSSSDHDNEAPSSWEIRASDTKALYDAGTYTILDTRSGLVETDWNQTITYSQNGTELASDNLSKSNEYNLSTIGAYKYYVLYITGNCGDADAVSLGEWALYGGGFTIPSQIGNTGRLLTTDGTSLGWATTAALPSVTVPEPTSTNKGRALVSTGTGIEFSDFNSGVSTGFKVYKSGTAFEEVTTNTAVLFDQTTTNVGAGHYDKVTGIYTVPVTGYYNIFANFEKLDVGFSCELASNNNINATGHHTITNWLLYSSGDIIPSYNINNNFNLTTGVFTSPCDGYYQANANIRIDGMSNYFRIYFSVNNQDNATGSGTGHNIVGSPSTNYESLMSSQIIFLKKNNTLRVKIYSNSDTSWIAQSESSWSCHLIEQKSEFVLQKSTNSGTSYTDIKKAKNNLSETVYLNQNDLIRITSDSTNKLTFNQGVLKNSFGAHLLNSGDSTSPIPIYGFSVDLTSDNNSLAADATITGWNYGGANEFALPTANFNSSTGVYTIPVTGYYDIKVSAETSSNVDGIYLSINDGNDDNITNVFRIKESGNVVSGSANIKLSINDTIRLKVEAAGNVLSSDTHWSCFLLASDTQTNTRQMGLSPIVPLHQLGHDQFAEGKTFEIDCSANGEKNLEISSGDAGLSVSNMGTIGTKETTYYLSNTTGTTLDSTTSLMYINRGGTKEFVVPPSPYTSGSNWTNANDYIRIRPLKDYENVENHFYATGSFTIDLSKILTNYIGLWNINIKSDDGVRLNINSQTFMIFTTSLSTGDNRVISINQKYINVEWTFFEREITEALFIDFYMVHPTPGMEIAEPVMPSITLPTPNSVNSGKVLVSNGSGYALENSGARNQNYIAITKISGGDIDLHTSQKILGDGTSGSGYNMRSYTTPLIVGNNFTHSAGKITIKNIGKYKVSWCASPYAPTAPAQAENAIGIGLYRYRSSSETNILWSSNSTDYHDGNNTHSQISAQVIVETTTLNEQYYLKAYSATGGTSNIWADTFSWIIEDMTPSAVPSINVPLPVAAHAGKALTVNSAGTGLEYDDLNVIKEYISGFCDGQTIATKSGTSLTIQNVTARQNGSTTYTDITGSSVTYLPPPGTTLVIYRFYFQIRRGNDLAISHYRFYIDDIEQPYGKSAFTAEDLEMRGIIEVPIRITGTTSSSNCTLANWNSAKTLKVKFREYHSSSYQMNLHDTQWWDGTGTETFCKPNLTLIAI